MEEVKVEKEVCSKKDAEESCEDQNRDLQEIMEQEQLEALTSSRSHLNEEEEEQLQELIKYVLTYMYKSKGKFQGCDPTGYMTFYEETMKRLSIPEKEMVLAFPILADTCIKDQVQILYDKHWRDWNEF